MTLVAKVKETRGVGLAWDKVDSTALSQLVAKADRLVETAQSAGFNNPKAANARDDAASATAGNDTVRKRDNAAAKRDATWVPAGTKRKSVPAKVR